MDCVFCKIIKRELPADIVYEDDEVIVFKDIYPQARVHLLFVPKKHFDDFTKLEEEDFYIIERIFKAIRYVTRKTKIEEDGFRMVLNTKRSAGQTVFHLHFHLLAHREFSERLL